MGTNMGNYGKKWGRALVLWTGIAGCVLPKFPDYGLSTAGISAGTGEDRFFGTPSIGRMAI